MRVFLPTLLAAVLFTAPATVAATFALVTGVGDYADPRNNLDCLDADLLNMHRLLRSLAVPPANIRTVANADATAAGIIRAFREHLVRNCGPGDTAIFYFSGHGFHVPDQNGDEEDGQDEIIVPRGIDGAKPDSYITDDQVAELIKEVKASQVVVILDCCHSGTGTRSLDTSIQKTWKPPYSDKEEFYTDPRKARPDGSFPYAPRPQNGFQKPRPEQANLLALAACKDDETALGPKVGSLFTTELARLVEAEPNQSMKELMGRLESAVAGRAREAKGHQQHPQFEGNPTATLVFHPAAPIVAVVPVAVPSISPVQPERPVAPVTPVPATPRPVAVVASAPAAGTMNVEIIQHRDFAVMIRLLAADDGSQLNEREVKSGREVRVQVSSEKDCHVRLFHTDAHGRVTLVYPNRFQTNDFIRAGAQVAFPDSNDGFKFVVEAPFGPELIKAVCSTQPFHDVQLPPEGDSPFFRTEALRPAGLSSRGLGAYSTRPGETVTRTLVGETYVSYVVRP